MFFEKYYINLTNKSNINIISSYKKIMSKFISLYIKKKKDLYINKINELYFDSIIYSKYYLYWKIYECTYPDDIMNILFCIEYLN